MTKQKEFYKFSRLPLTISGNSPFAEVSGSVEWTLKEDGTLHRVHLMQLETLDGMLVEVEQDEMVYDIVAEALEKQAAAYANQRRHASRGESPQDPLDKPDDEGAPSETI